MLPKQGFYYFVFVGHLKIDTSATHLYNHFVILYLLDI